MNVWLGLLLGIATSGWGQSPDRSSAQPPPEAVPPASTILDAPPAGPASPPPQPIDEYVLMVTGNNEPNVRLIGARRLLAAGSEEAVGRLATILQAGPADLAAQSAVCQAIADCDDPMTPLAEPLLALLGNQQPALTPIVIQALRRFDNGMVVDRLRSIAADATMAAGRRDAAINALGEMGDNMKAVAALVALTRDDHDRIRTAALAGLWQATGVRHADPEAASAWWKENESTTPVDWMRSINERRVLRIRDLQGLNRRLIGRLVTSYRESYLRTPEPERPARLLAFLGDGLVDVRNLGLDLINVLITDRQEVGQETQARLIEMMTDPDDGLRLKVAIMVGDLRPPGAVTAMLDALKHETDNRVRAIQVNAIGRLDGAEAIPALIELLDDDVGAVVCEAALALAAITRRTEHDAQAIGTVESALLRRFEKIEGVDGELREAFLHAMALTAAEGFREVFRAELAPDRSLQIRRAAIAGLGAYSDAAAAELVRTFMTAPEVDIRLAAVQALGKCGRRTEDLEALAGRLDSVIEPDQGIRDRAWESFQQIARQLPPADLLLMSDRFAIGDDPAAQRRRLDLLRSIAGASKRFELLSSQDQVGLYDRIADTHLALGNPTAAATSLEQAVGLLADREDPRFTPLMARLVTALLRCDQDEAAAQRVRDSVSAGGEDDKAVDTTHLSVGVFEEVRTRLAAAGDAQGYARAGDLIATMSAAFSEARPDVVRQLASLQDQLVAGRNAVIDRLLGSITTDPQAEPALLDYGKGLVLPRLIIRLSATPITTAPTNGGDDRLVAFARRLVEQWPGYEPGCSPDERNKALDTLRAMGLAAQPKPTTPPTTSPATTPP